ncbi:hypothetical protein C6A37_07720, partial [Desulfobacteraceae bacterium SEEP-SAG9]
KSGLVAAIGDKVVDPALQVIDSKVAESGLSDSQKRAILTYSPLVLGLLSGATIELKIDKLLKNPLAVGLFDGMFKQKASPEQVIDKFKTQAEDINFRAEEIARADARAQVKTESPPDGPPPGFKIVEPEETPLMAKVETGIEPAPETPKARPARSARPRQPAGSKVRTLRGRVKLMGGINFLNFKGELREMSTAVKFLSKKSGTPIDLAERTLRDEGWLSHDETLLDVLRHQPEILRRGKLGQGLSEKPAHELTDAEKRLQKEMDWEPESPPEGDYVQVKAADLPEGKELTIIDGNSIDGWDTYRVIDKDPFGIKLQDGTTVELRPTDKVEVLSSDLKAPKRKTRGPSDTELMVHPSTITGPIGAISAGIDWKEYKETG